jgi:hypothetical protein
MKYDYLKYWKVVREWHKIKYNLKLADLEMLLFLCSEDFFTSQQFYEYDDIFYWDDKRLRNLIKDGWVKKHRKGTPGVASIYRVTEKTKRMVNSMYKTLNLQQEISESRLYNPVFKKKIPYSHKMMREAIKKMNKEIRELRLRHAQESHDSSPGQS